VVCGIIFRSQIVAYSSSTTLTKDNNTTTLTLTPGYAYFVVKFFKDGKVIDKVSTAGNLNKGNNTVVVSSVRGTWTFDTPFRTMDVAQQEGFDNVSQLHIAMNGASDFDLLYKTIFKEDIDEYTSVEDESRNMTEIDFIISKYLGLLSMLPMEIAKHPNSSTPYKSNYYYGIVEYGSDSDKKGLPMILTMTRQFKGGTGAVNWNGLMTSGDSIEIEFDNGTTYEFMILGFAPNIDNGTMGALSQTPLTTVNGDNMSGMALESILTYSQKCEMFDNNTNKWVSVNCIDDYEDQMQAGSLNTATLKAAKKIGKVSKAGIVTSEGCVDNVTDTWVDLEHYGELCKNGTQLALGGSYWYNNTTNSCPQGFTEIYNVYIKAN